MSNNKNRFSKCWECIKRRWKIIVLVIVIIGVLLAIIFLSIKGYIDTNQFLTDFFSGIIVVLVGWFLAWIIVHRYLRRNIEIQNKNKIIEEIAAFKISLRETTDAWMRLKQDETNNNLWQESRKILLETTTNYEILFIKILNQYPDYLSKKFEFKDKKNEKQIFKLKEIVDRIITYTNKISDSLNNSDYSENTTISIKEKEQKVTQYLSYVLREIIREPFNKQ